MSSEAARPVSVWRSYRAQYSAERPGSSPLRLALKLVDQSLKHRRVRNATFEDISNAGCDVRVVEDGAKQFLPSPGVTPKHWKRPIEAIVPKVARLRNVELFRDGSIPLPDGRYCYFDTCFLSNLEDDRIFGPSGKSSLATSFIPDSTRFSRHVQEKAKRLPYRKKRISIRKFRC